MSMMSAPELLAAARAKVREVSGEDVRAAAATLIDVREVGEYREGAIPKALHIPRGFLELKIESLVPDRATPLILYCAGGNRSLLAGVTLKQMGYENVASLSGGYTKWASQGLPTEKPNLLSDTQRRRYQRHLNVPEIGEVGQLTLLKSRVAIIGMGGLGSPIAFYLAGAGVGTLGLVDFDTVDESNLQRQILHSTLRVGEPKVESAVKALRAFNPEIQLQPIPERLNADNVEPIFSNYDLILDGSDNFSTRYLINDACVRLRKPCVFGSVNRFEGQVSVLVPGGPCYRCLYPEPGNAPSCSEAGVLGAVPGVIGALQSVEAVKVLLSIGRTLAGRLIRYDGLSGKFSEFQLVRDNSCNACR